MKGTTARARRAARVAIAALICTLPATGALAAIKGTSTATVGGITYEGLGAVNPPANTIGSGRYTLGSCSFDGSNTNCSLTGSYVEDIDSSNAPGSTGTFELSFSYAGNGPTPIIARASNGNSDSVFLHDMGGTFLRLTIMPSSGGSFTGIFPDTPFSNSIGFSAFLQPGTFSCTGLAPGQSCRIRDVGRTPGAVITGQVSPFQFTLPDNAPPIPEPGTWAMMLAGLAGVGAITRRRASGR